MQLHRSSKYTWIILQLSLIGLLSILFMTIALASDERNVNKVKAQKAVITEFEFVRKVLEARTEIPRFDANSKSLLPQSIDANHTEKFIIRKFYLSPNLLQRTKSKEQVSGKKSGF